MFDYYSLTKYSVPDLAAAALALSKRDTEPLEKVLLHLQRLEIECIRVIIELVKRI